VRNIFNVRVYGILIHNNAILVSDEYIKKNKITKLPGGGLEYGEGTRDCLIREFNEELNLKIELISHFYTTDFFVNSSFDTNSQVLSIYYIVQPLSDLNFKVSETAHNYEMKEGAQAFRWIELNDLRETDFSLIIDRKVAELIIRSIQK
jgi:ADP-ribose pyrophosphatase YjhB (NUDIX family)